MPMDAWRSGDDFVVAFDLPGVAPESIDLDVESNVITVRAERAPSAGEDVEMIAAERPRGVFSRQLVLGENLDTDRIAACYDDGVLTLRIPVAEQAKPRKIENHQQRLKTTADQRLKARSRSARRPATAQAA